MRVPLAQVSSRRTSALARGGAATQAAKVSPSSSRWGDEAAISPGNAILPDMYRSIRFAGIGASLYKNAAPVGSRIEKDQTVTFEGPILLIVYLNRSGVRVSTCFLQTRMKIGNLTPLGI